MKANPVFSLYIPTKLVFGCGEIKKLSSEKLPGKKALVVISSGTSMRKYGYLERVLAQLRLNNVETLVYDKILPNPIKEHVMEAAAICREEKCDFVVGLGGGLYENSNVQNHNEHPHCNNTPYHNKTGLLQISTPLFQPEQ